MTTPPAFTVRGVSKSFLQGDVSIAALTDVSLEIASGEFTVIAGASGSGKSTLLHLMGGLDRPDRGDVLVAGTALAGASDGELSEMRRHRLGFVFQALNLVPVLSAFENVEYGLWLQGLPAKARRPRVEAVLASVGLADRMHHRPDHLSGGQRQRVALARALVHDPIAIVADEPTASLDSRTGQAMVDLLLELNAGRGTTFVFATHDPAIIARAPRVVSLADGRIVDDSRRSPH